MPPSPSTPPPPLLPATPVGLPWPASPPAPAAPPPVPVAPAAPPPVPVAPAAPPPVPVAPAAPPPVPFAPALPPPEPPVPPVVLLLQPLPVITARPPARSATTNRFRIFLSIWNESFLGDFEEKVLGGQKRGRYVTQPFPFTKCRWTLVARLAPTRLSLHSVATPLRAASQIVDVPARPPGHARRTAPPGRGPRSAGTSHPPPPTGTPPV